MFQTLHKAAKPCRAVRQPFLNASFFRSFSTADATQQEESPPTVSIDTNSEDETLRDHLSTWKPSVIVAQLERHIVGQADAKRAVAISLRNRWRRQQIHESIRAEITPKNILMVGPTGCGKTEIARRLATLAGSPFIKVEATKFTEVGFHGKDVDTIIRDLIEASIKLVKEQKTDLLKIQVQKQINEIILNKLVGGSKVDSKSGNQKEDSQHVFSDMLEQGNLEAQTIVVEVPVQQPNAPGGPSIVGVGMEKGQIDLGEIMKNLSGGGGGKGKTEAKKMTIGEARPILEKIEMEKLLNTIDITAEAIALAEQSGIVFIDEIDKICSSGDYRGADASAEGVQRDMLPLIEGSSITTKHGDVNTDHMLFVCSGAFHNCKPSDLLPELQGRLPIRVELQGLKEKDLYRILTEPEMNLIKQQQMLLGTEGVDLEFDDEAVHEIAKIAADMNHTVENIGARRLHTVMEKIMEEISFDADEKAGETITIGTELVVERVGEMLKKQDLQKFIL